MGCRCTYKSQLTDGTGIALAWDVPAAIPYAYARRHPEKTVLYRVLQNELTTFLAEAESNGTSVPRFVERDLRRFLNCGILQHGFYRVECRSCRTNHLVGFSCKGRICPSCAAKRMNEVAAHLVDNVIPDVPVRQWVITFP